MSRAILSEREARIARLRGQVLPAVTTMLGSATVLLPLVATSPVLPPFGFMMLLAWRLLRPELWPLWIGLPLGLVDDLFSGQPIGSAPLLWTIVLLAHDQVARQNLLRDHWQDWMTAVVAISFVLGGGLVAANLAGGASAPETIVPQLLLSCLLYPVVARSVATLDRWRLA